MEKQTIKSKNTQNILRNHLRPAHNKEVVKLDQIQLFKTCLIELLEKKDIIDKRPKDETEEHLKIDMHTFLRDVFYKNYAINTKGNSDLVIHHESSTDSKVAVLIEAKRPSNTNEMFSPEKQNCKAPNSVINSWTQN